MMIQALGVGRAESKNTKQEIQSRVDKGTLCGGLDLPRQSTGDR